MGKQENENRVMAKMSRRGFLKFAGLTGATFAAGGLFAGCSTAQSGSANSSADDDNKTQTITDMNGTEVTVPVNPERYADGWYAHNEVTIMLTGANGLVATAVSPSSYQWMYKVCPNMNNAVSTFGTDFNFEDLVELDPQVIFSSTEDLRSKCDEVGIPMVNCMFTTYEDMKKSIDMTAQIFGGDAPSIASRYNSDLDDVLDEVKSKTEKLSDADRPKVLHGNSVYGMNVDGKNTIIDDWITIAGGTNAIDDPAAGTNMITVSLEQIVTWNPAIIITGNAAEVDKIMNDSAWSSIDAVKNKQVYVNPKGVFGWDRYGVEELLQVQWAAATIQPTLFKDYDMTEKVKDFYEIYLSYTLTDDDAKLILSSKNPA